MIFFSFGSCLGEGKVAASYIARGDLVPNELVTKLMVDAINGEFKDSSWLLDGFPRTLKQAQSLLEQTSLTKVINLNVPDEEIISRIKHRWVISHHYGALLR